MGKARTLVATNLEQLAQLSASGHTELRDFAVANGLDTSAGFAAFKKELLAVGIDYVALRAQRPLPTLLSVPALRERGWTDSMVKRFLGEPDHLRDNPRYRSAAPMRLYAENRVVAVEASEEFLVAKQRGVRRSAAGTKAANTRREQLMAQVAEMLVTVRRLAPDKLLQNAIRHYNKRKAEYALDCEDFDYQLAGPDSDSAFLQRIQVNYARHQLSQYDHHLEETAGKTGVVQAVGLIREKVYAAISQAYPYLAEECRRQLAERQPATA